jgi:hypothetical protein
MGSILATASTSSAADDIHLQPTASENQRHALDELSDPRPKKRAKTSPSIVDALPDDCLGVVASFLPLSDIGRYQSTCSATHAVVQSVSEDLYKQLACSMFSEQHMLAVKGHVTADITWRERLRQQIVSKQRSSSERTDYSLDDFRIVISVKLPDYSSYNLEQSCIDKHIPVTIVSPIVFDGFVELTAGESPTSILFMSDSMLEDESSPFVKYLSIKQINDLKEQKAKAIEESEELKEEGSVRPNPPCPQLDALLKMVEAYTPSYKYSYLESVAFDKIDVSILHSTTGKMAFIGTITSEDLDSADYGESFMNFSPLEGFSPDSFRGNPFVTVTLKLGNHVVEGNDVIIKINVDVQIEEFIDDDFDETSEMSQKDACLLFESLLLD